MIPISSLISTEFRGGPSLVQRFNGFTSALVTGQPKPGYSSGQMLAAVRRLADSSFAPRGVGYAFSGQSYQEGIAGGQAGVIFVLGLIMVFLVLAAQYESWSIPFAVLLGIPFGAFGAFLGVWLRGMASDVYFQIGLLVVVGLAAKNAILIVEFASQLRGQGRSIREAAIEAAHERFRPILMTSFAFILGVAPLLIASGAGAESRHSIGTGVFFGMLTATTVGIFFIPLFYYLIGRLGERGLFRRQVIAPVPAGAGATPSPEVERWNGPTGLGSNPRVRGRRLCRRARLSAARAGCARGMASHRPDGGLTPAVLRLAHGQPGYAPAQSYPAGGRLDRQLGPRGSIPHGHHSQPGLVRPAARPGAPQAGRDGSQGKPRCASRHRHDQRVPRPVRRGQG
jgi:hypothetical protein